MKTKTQKRRSLPRRVRRFTIHEGLGNWFVRLGSGKESRMLCLCTRGADAHYIASVLNQRHEMDLHALDKSKPALMRKNRRILKAPNDVKVSDGSGQ